MDLLLSGVEVSKKMSGGEAMVRMFQHHGVEVIFGLCGDTSLLFYDAMYRLDHNIKHVLTRDERCAGYMADVYARISGKVGVCEGPSGGGATHILPALVEAGESSFPILAFNSDVGVRSRGKFPLTELDMKNLFAPVTKWNDVVDTANEIAPKMRSAFRSMTTQAVLGEVFYEGNPHPDLMMIGMSFSDIYTHDASLNN